jgi:hypothetical protein
VYNHDYAEIYDQIHLDAGKDHAAEAAAVVDAISTSFSPPWNGWRHIWHPAGCWW